MTVVELTGTSVLGSVRLAFALDVLAVCAGAVAVYFYGRFWRARRAFRRGETAGREIT